MAKTELHPPINRVDKKSKISSYLLAILSSLSLLAIGLIKGFHEYFLNRLPEASDFAANSILIESAKHLELFHGNYSRLGFFHPGPAFLQVQALGEIVFHDILNVSASEIGGQSIAALIFNCLLLLLLFTAINVREGTPRTAFFIPTFIFILLRRQPNAISGMWMPHLYIIPFTCFVYCLALTATNSLRTTLEKALLLISVGLLVHGHASFLGITAIGLLMALTAGAAQSPKKLEWIFKSVSDLFRPRLLIAIPAAFLLPILIHTIIHYPGELAKYFTYTRDTSAHPLDSSALFALTFFPGQLKGLILFACIAIFFCWLGTSAHRNSADQTDGRPARNIANQIKISFSQPIILAAWTFLFTFLLSWLYSARGVDDLSDVNAYTIFWTTGGYSISIAFLLISFMQRLISWLRSLRPFTYSKISSIQLVATSSALTILTSWLVFLPPYIHRDLSVQTISASIQDKFSHGKNTPPRIGYKDHMQWPIVAGVLLDLKRHGISACTTWTQMDFLYTKQMICSPDEKWNTKILPAVNCNNNCKHGDSAFTLIYEKNKDE